MSRQDALIIIDVQQGMFGFPGIGPVTKTDLLNNIGRLAKDARNADCHVIYIQHDGNADHPLSKEKPGHEIPAEIRPEPGDHIVTKKQCGMFTETKLEQILQELDIKRLIICGMQTEFCVDTGVRTGADRGYNIIVAKDAHATFDTPLLSAKQIAEHHEALWGQAFASVQSVNDIQFAGAEHAPA
ncbi:MAG: cysteine hydrolase family protein [Pseudomonadota bacterium]